jgi:hypothetical protein
VASFRELVPVADIFAIVAFVSRNESVESKEIGVEGNISESGVNIVRSMESRPVLLDCIAVSENHSSNLVQSDHGSSNKLSSVCSLCSLCSLCNPRFCSR